ncbi:MAG: hypothetical protein ACKVS5_09010 [Parvularculaceae bacterium]
MARNRNPLSVLCAMSAAMAIAATAAASPTGGSVILKASGDRGWTLDCTFQRGDASPLTRKARGRGKVETIAVKGATAGACEYSGPGRGAFQIRFVDENAVDDCPFVRIEDACIGRFEAGASGTFSF